MLFGVRGLRVFIIKTHSETSELVQVSGWIDSAHTGLPLTGVRGTPDYIYSSSILFRFGVAVKPGLCWWAFAASRVP